MPSAQPDKLSPAERAIYNTTFLGRGDYTNLRAEYLLTYARQAQAAVEYLQRRLWCDKRLTPEQATLFRLLLALITEDRNKWLDLFFNKWTPEDLKSALDNPNMELEDDPSGTRNESQGPDV